MNLRKDHYRGRAGRLRRARAGRRTLARWSDGARSARSAARAVVEGKDAPPRGAGAGWRVPGSPSAPRPSAAEQGGGGGGGGRTPAGPWGSFPRPQGQVPSVRASAASPRRASRAVPCASALLSRVRRPAGPGRGWPRASGSGLARVLGRGAGRRFKDSGGPRRPGEGGGARRRVGGARCRGVGARGRRSLPPALAPGGRRARPPRAAGPERGVDAARSSLRGPVSAERRRARALGRCRPRLRSEGAETRVSAPPRPRRALGGAARRAVSGAGRRAPPERRRRRWRRRRRSFRAGARPRPRVPSAAPRRSRRSPLATSVAASPPGSTLGLAGRAERAGGRAGVGACRRRSPRGGAESGRRSSFRCRPVGRPAARPRRVPARASAKAGGGVRRREGPEGKGVRRAPLRGKARARGWPSGGRAVRRAPSRPAGGAGSGGRVGRGGGGGAVEDAGVGAGRSEARRRGGRAAVSAGPGRAGRLGRTRSEPGSSWARAVVGSAGSRPSCARVALSLLFLRVCSYGQRRRRWPAPRSRLAVPSVGPRSRPLARRPASARGGGRSFRVVRRSGAAGRSRKRPRKGSARSGPGPPRARARGGAEKADNS